VKDYCRPLAIPHAESTTELSPNQSPAWYRLKYHVFFFSLSGGRVGRPCVVLTLEFCGKHLRWMRARFDVIKGEVVYSDSGERVAP